MLKIYPHNVKLLVTGFSFNLSFTWVASVRPASCVLRRDYLKNKTRRKLLGIVLDHHYTIHKNSIYELIDNYYLRYNKNNNSMNPITSPSPNDQFIQYITTKHNEISLKKLVCCIYQRFVFKLLLILDKNKTNSSNSICMRPRLGLK